MRRRRVQSERAFDIVPNREADDFDELDEDDFDTDDDDRILSLDEFYFDDDIEHAFGFGRDLSAGGLFRRRQLD